MKKKILLLLALALTFVTGSAQDAPRQHHIFKQFTSADTPVHKNLMKRFRNMMESTPAIQLEEVCHGLGMDRLMNDRNIAQGKVTGFAGKGIVGPACGNTNKERALDRPNVLPVADSVKAGSHLKSTLRAATIRLASQSDFEMASRILHVVEREEESRNCIKAGF